LTETNIQSGMVRHKQHKDIHLKSNKSISQ